DRIAGLPDQCRQAWQEGSAFPLPDACAEAQSVVLMGMGGSAIGGDLIAGLATLETGPPITVLRDYRIPSWVGPSTLAIASSYSGNTEETLAMYQHAREKGACMVAITSGGTLAQLAQRDGIPLFKVNYQGEPRSAVGYSFVVPLAFLSKLGLLAGKGKEMEEAVGAVRGMAGTLATEVPLAQNQAKGLAMSLQGRLPVVYGAGFLSGVARRWKTQLNENSKVWAFWEELSELHHNAVEGYSLPPHVREQAFVVLLHSRFLHPRISLRYQITQELLAQNGIPYHQVEGLGDSPLAHLLSLALLGDYTSYYLAMLNQVDPAVMPVIDHLKGRLAGE
ncbi:MAG: bifunctional phosphoglucose/phosphomannose isomerase, partial [Dehalococcoidia bacterium]|nr:bifunctional phosphoglucose/phosphomannose isomerase [Dehalococcoidia bacterium]